MRARRWLFAIWICFLARAFFYCAALPLWEGYDEWAHFAVVRRMALHGEPLVSRDSPIPRDVAASLELAPVPWECRNIAPSALTHDDFWRLDPAARALREAAFRALPNQWAFADSAGPLKAYEGLQGPLYGWIVAPILLAFRHAHLATQVLALRWFSMALASLVIPLTFLVGRAVFRDDTLALGCAAVVAAMPGFLITTARVSNESLAVVLFVLLLWLAVEELTGSRVVWLGIVLGLGLIAKAYFLTAIPPVVVLLAWKYRRPRALLALLLAVAIAGWWYVRNLRTTGTLSGMYESAALPGAGLLAQLRQAAHIRWGVVIDSILFSHLWHGAWSSLTVRSWMYHLFYLLIGLAVVGQASRKALAPRAILALFYVSFWLGQLYHSILLFMVWGVATTLGAYLYTVVAAEAALCIAGLRTLSPPALRRFVAPAGVTLFALFDLYTVHLVALPYYAGLIAHRPNGSLAAFHPGSLDGVLTRLLAFKSPILTAPVFVSLWIGYAAATVALAAITFAAARRETAR